VSLHEPALEEARYLLSPDVIDPLLERPYTRQTEHNANVACSRSFFHCAQAGTQISGYVARAGMSQGSTDGIAHVRSLLAAVIGSEWRITASWPIDTEDQNRTRAQDSVSLHSSINIILVCRPRENSNGEIRTKCQSTDRCSEEVQSLWHVGEWYLASVDELSPMFNNFRRISPQGACGISIALTVKEAIATCLRKAKQAEPEEIFQ
jgi:hypothetical protein